MIAITEALLVNVVGSEGSTNGTREGSIVPVGIVLPHSVNVNRSIASVSSGSA